MTSQQGSRDPSVIKEELGDLLSYLKGIPDDIKRNGAFIAYEQRAAELSRELILADLTLFCQHMPSGFAHDLAPANVVEAGKLQEGLSILAREYQKSADHRLLVSRAIYWGVLITSAGSLVSATSAAMSFVVPFSAIAASLAALSIWRFAEKASRQERLASHLANLKEEIAHSLGPSGEVLKPSEYYPASTRRIEQLLEEIKTQVASGTGSGA